MTILDMSAGGALLIAAVLILRRAALYRLPKWSFLLLWAAALCRLLLPFSLPSQLSIYTGAARIAQAMEQEAALAAPAGDQAALPPVFLPETPREDIWVPVPAAPEREPASPLTAVYLTGCALCGLFFVVAYGAGIRRFSDAVPAESDFLRLWQEEHPALPPVKIRTCGEISSPMAYGLLRPVVLLPENTDWSDEAQLTYVLTHEYVHIRRGDLLWKLLLTAALCVHWFNPLVWAMYLCANRDLELACDEAVVRILGLEHRKGYACALLSAAESGFSPLCITYTTKHHMEERIRAIMKMKKRSAAAILTAALLVAGITAVFATSKAPPKDISDLPQAVASNQGNALTPAPTPGSSSGSSTGSVPGEASFIWPLPQEYQEISYPFTKRVVNPITGQVKDHPGIDISAPKGTAVYAAKSGVVVRSEQDTAYGNLVELSHSDGTGTLYAHLSQRAVEAGQTVKQGETVGAVGATGTATGPALHFGIFVDGNPVNPAEQFQTDVILNDSARGGKLDPSQMAGMDLEAVREEVKNNRWGVPLNPIPEGTEFTVPTPEEASELCDFLQDARGIRDLDLLTVCNSDRTYTVRVTYQKTREEEETKARLANGYPVNSRGETYGKAGDVKTLGYAPDLVAAAADNGAKGYMLYNDYEYFGYPGKVETQEDRTAFLQWQDAQPDPITLPVYDVDRSTVVGYHSVYNSPASGEPTGGVFNDDELKWLEESLRRVGIKEGDIARELEKHRAPEG